MYDNLIEALRRNATDEALSTARALVATHPQDPQAHRWLAVALQQNGEAEAALASINQAIALAPEDAGLHVAHAGLLVGTRQNEAARSALAQASGLDPNQFDAYAMQAQLALGRGDLDEAERLSRLAARVAPEHPQLAAIDGMLALRRGKGDDALKLVSAALQREPEDIQLRYALGFIYMEKGLWAFAEQAFRGVLEKTPAAATLRPLIAELMRRQGRPAEAAEELAPLLGEDANPALRRFAGQLRLAAGQPGQALPLLLQVLAQLPDDRGTLAALVEAGRVPALHAQVRDALEAALATHPQAVELWQARLAIEPLGEAGRELLERWVAQMPGSTVPLAAQMGLHARLGESVAAETLAHRILGLDPDQGEAQVYVLDKLLVKDPRAAIERIEEWSARATQPARQQALLGWLGQAQDRAGLRGEALATWTRFHANAAPSRTPLPPTSAPPRQWPALGEMPPQPAMTMFLWGAPGSGVERLAAVMATAAEPFRGDRFGATPPRDGLQDYAVVDALVSGRVSGEAVIRQWRETLPVRGVANGHVFDWLPWWDNSLLMALRPHVREGMLMIALRDPRDMLLEWLAFGTAMPFAMPAPQRAAGWLAIALNQVASLVEEQWYPNRVVRTDLIENDPQAAADALSEAMKLKWPAPASTGPLRFPAGHWREYAQVLAEPFALLTPVAVRLGYPEN
ncbi:adenylate cyclase [Pseudoxanthomonas yeongjuensis]|uniref:tetratricopeptide repeat protein n=1 Tax=Pseudoxanthomonas yeongjuensis TaxID=377616 RepID=UPI001391D70B|nr:tetratricopeptide repeat protein [Pseudoxanthomonas yeongjuensis]KAF1716706.1 adenylate cyclase [Pseudoxanthomonas yeongjuensis]